MVDIRDFFGNKKAAPKKPTTKPAAKPKPASPKSAQKRQVETIHLSDEDEEVVRPVKRAKPSKSIKKEEKKSSRPNSLVISADSDDDDDFVMEDDKDDPAAADDDFKDDDFDDDDDDFMEELDSLQEIKSSSKKTPSPTKPAERPKRGLKREKEELSPPPPAFTPKKKPAVKKTTASPSVKTNTGVTAMDVLATIPDATLPEDIATDKGSGFNFRDFKAKQAQLPTSSGDIEIPEGAPNCLTGLTMVFTGVMPNITREDAEALAKKYGAKVTKSISSKTSVVVLGEEAGPSKVKKIKQFKIKAIDEAGFIQLIKGMPEEGGDGETAEKARLIRQREKEAAREESLRMQQEEERAQQKKQAEVKKAQKAGNFVKASDLKTDADKLWTTRYAPTKLDQLCGNKGAAQKLYDWLATWQQRFGGRKPEKGESDFRAVLIHGPPGIGKTTVAHLVANQLGYDVIEKNASDVRSEKLLNANIGGILNNTSVVGHFQQKQQKTANDNKFCIIMDEVDGMSGGDRGGVGALAAFCRKTQAPMILICNDKSNQKMRPFDRVTLDLPFRRPSAREMKSRLMTIALREGIKLDPNVIDQLVAATNNDIRQIINLLSTVSRTQKTIDSSNTKNISQDWQKNVALKIFDIIPRLLSGRAYTENTDLPLYKKMELYFDDHAFVPLMMQENYLSTNPSRATSKSSHLELAARAADSISEGDLVDAKIHSGEQLWSLMPLHSIMSTVRPGSIIAGQVVGRINFSSWLGQNSKTGKYYRLLTELQYRARLRTSTSAKEFRADYIPVLAKKLLSPLMQKGAEGIEEVIAILDEYYLTKTDWDYLMEFPIGVDNTTMKLKKIPAAAKSKFTRVYNKGSHPISVYKPGTSTGVSKGRSKDKPDIDDVVEDDEFPEDEEEE